MIGPAFASALIGKADTANLTEEEKNTCLQHLCLKGILYVSKTTVLTDALKQKLETTFNEIPFIVVRVDTLPKNAPIELEMTAMMVKSAYQIVFTPDGLTVTDTDGNIAYQFLKFNSLETFLGSDSLVGAGRVDIFLESTESLGPGSKEAVQDKCPKATVSESYVLEILSDAAQGGPIITAEFIDMTATD